ncbi:hypothetical protein PLESTB_000199100 [Pleodorina starrii]|uniref:SET domain-containing protein n=1 Tax=Pleodorina starrii TaxID=330485 RepID=A0A9W6BCR3_9CHLO|nr:hypothetical protein PLESTM_000332700 [Pleodorina starrii]GLC49252.1 hypothetical protein PLESTB_000199100 [Pleodorina starrii]GLC73494.1 hypothetical protein PLESTF_001383800 [Pleodorina starrii]
MQRTLHCSGQQTCTSSVRERILSSFYNVPSTSGRCPSGQCSHVLLTARPRRHKDCLPCPAAKGGKGASSQGFKGFGEPPKAPKKPERQMAFDPEDELEPAAGGPELEGEDEEEIVLMPSYQMYTDVGYKAPRYIGQLKLDRPEGEPLPVLCSTTTLLPGELALVSPALGLAEGGFQQVPELEDLHAAILEDGPGPAQRRVLTLLDSLRPGQPTSPASSSSPSAAAAAAPPEAVLPSLTTLDVKFWSGRGRDAAAPAFDSRRLMRLLSRTAIADDSQDPAAMQARHQKPVGYVGLWPEAALLAHSCVPNTSQLVVGDRLFMHVTEELQPGASLSRNLIGAAITAPLSVRQAAVAEALAEQGVAAAEPPPLPALRACRCPRCELEASVSEGLRDTLEEAHAWYVNEATEAWNKANESEDLALLRGLLEECETIVAEVEEAVQGEPGLDDEQQDWLRASAYDVYDMLVTLDELVNQDAADLDVLRTCLELIRVHSPGSGSHMMVALKHESLRRHRLEVFNEMLKREGRVGRKAGGDVISKTDRRKLAALKQAADLAAEFRIEAVVLRYGLVTEAIIGQLTEGLETYVEGLEQMSVMAAQGMTELTREMEVEGVRVQIVDRLEVSEASRAGPGAQQVVSQDGVQLMVVEDAEEPPEVATGARRGGAAAEWAEDGEVEEEGALLLDGEMDGEEGEVFDLEVDPDSDFDVDAAVQAAVERALRAANAAEGEQAEEQGAAPAGGR